jgi:hypothetical protein
MLPLIPMTGVCYWLHKRSMHVSLERYKVLDQLSATA